MDGINIMLNGEIKEVLTTIKTLEAGTTEKTMAIEQLDTLYKLRLQEIKENNEVSHNKEEIVEKVKDRIFRIGVESIGIIVPIIFYSIWMRKGFKFEETGTYTSSTFKGLFSRFKPTRK